MADDLAPTTVRTRFNYVKIVVRAAVADRHLAEDVTRGVRLPATRKREHAMVIPTPGEVRQVLEVADEHYAPLFALCAFAGLRLGGCLYGFGQAARATGDGLWGSVGSW